MADIQFNISRSRAHQMQIEEASGFGVLLLQDAEADATLQDYTTVAAILAESGNVEADFTDYARKTGVEGSVNVDNTGNLVDISIPNQTWEDAGNGTNNSLEKAIIFWDPAGTEGADNTLVPIVALDVSVSTNGTDLNLNFSNNRFLRATS